MAEAGFFRSSTDRDADITRCFVCFKELEGWEPEDSPMYVLHAYDLSLQNALCCLHFIVNSNVNFCALFCDQKWV